jgi:hypothetical protein
VKKQYMIALAALVAAACSDAATAPTAPVAPPDLAVGEQGLHGAPEHLVSDKHQASSRKPGGSANMLWHNGAILVAAKTQAIFWGAEWQTATFQGDKITGMDSFFNGYGGSAYAAASSEYTGTNGQVTPATTYLGHVFDYSAAPSKAPSVTAAVAEVCKVTNNAPDPTGVYFLFTSTHAGQVSYCAWHSYGTCSNGAGGLHAEHRRGTRVRPR